MRPFRVTARSLRFTWRQERRSSATLWQFACWEARVVSKIAQKCTEPRIKMWF